MKLNEHMGNVWKKELGHIKGELLAMRHLNSGLKSYITRPETNVQKRMFNAWNGQQFLTFLVPL